MVALRSWIQFTALVTAIALLMGPVGPTVAAQTFVQVPELSPERVVGPRITETIAMNRLNRHLFASLNAKVTFVDALLSPPRAYEFSSDGVWSRVLFGEKDEYIYPFTNAGSSTLRLLGPGGVDISANRTLFIADQLNGRVVLARFNAGSKSLAQVAVTPDDPDLGGVVDVAWDGSVAPLTTENFYALDGADSAGREALAMASLAASRAQRSTAGGASAVTALSAHRPSALPALARELAGSLAGLVASSLTADH